MMIFKQFAVGIGIAVLLPLLVYYGAALPSPPANRSGSDDIYLKQQNAKTPAEKKKIDAEIHRQEKEQDAADKRNQQMEFYVAYPVGILAIIAGAFLAVTAVGAGLMFGGIFTLTTGSYFYWDKMGDILHFGAILIALVVIASLGIWKVRPQHS